MPITYSTYRTPQGREALGMTSVGTVTGADAEDFRRMTVPGGVHFAKPLYIVVDRATEVTTEARRVFTQPAPPDAPRMPCAIVTPTTTLRVLLNFMTRVSGGESTTRFFSTEADAAAWLDEQLAALEAAGSAPGGRHG